VKLAASVDSNFTPNNFMENNQAISKHFCLNVHGFVTNLLTSIFTRAMHTSKCQLDKY